MSEFVKDAEQAFDGNSDQQQTGQDMAQNDQQSTDQKSGGGFMGGLKQDGEDAAINTEVNNFASKEGIPQGADGAIDAVVDGEANKYL